MSEPTINSAALAKIRNLPMLHDDDVPRPEFLLWENQRTQLSCYYAPFEYLNTKAKLILVGAVLLLTVVHLRYPRAHALQGAIFLATLAIVWLGLDLAN